MMKKISIGALLVAMAVVMAAPAQAAFTVGGENGWSLSTDGIVDIFAAYQTTSGLPSGARELSLLTGAANDDQKFGVRVGLLPSIIAFNVKAPTTAGIDSTMRAALYPNNQNTSNNRFNTSPNIDFREFFYTASGKFGSILAGRALNLFQGQNILNDMTLFTAGVVDMTQSHGGTSLGHIGYGYLYANFGPQLRYTTPDLGGLKVAFAIAEPYAISTVTGKTATPRLETEISFATKFSGGSVHAWLGALWQQDTRNTDPGSAATPGSIGPPVVAGTDATPATARPGKHNQSIGFAPGVNVSVGPVGLMLSGYMGRGLGMTSAQDGAALGAYAVDNYGKEREHWGFLAQSTFQVTDAIRLGANYGRNDSSKTNNEKSLGYGVDGAVPKKTQEAVVLQANYNLNKFTQFTLEGIYAVDSWMDHRKVRSKQFALGTVFFW